MPVRLALQGLPQQSLDLPAPQVAHPQSLVLLGLQVRQVVRPPSLVLRGLRATPPLSLVLLALQVRRAMPPPSLVLPARLVTPVLPALPGRHLFLNSTPKTQAHPLRLLLLVQMLWLLVERAL